jgi:Domain of unknown function (DUF4214)
MFTSLIRGKYRLLGACAILVLLLPPSRVSGAEYCAGGSEIDEVPTFINQIFVDALQRKPTPEDQRFWAARIEGSNSQRCKSANPSVLATPCEWQNAAQAVVDIMGTPASISKNGPIGSNNEFVTAVYRILLRRAPDASGFQFHLSGLNSGKPRESVALSGLLSEEYRKRFSCRQEVHQAEAISPGGSGSAELGVNGHPLTQPVYSDSTGVSYDDQLKYVHELGAQWYRIDLTPRADLAKMDILVKKAQEHGVQILPGIFALYDSANDDSATIEKKSHDRAFEVVSRYKSSIHVWELGNEDDNASLYHPGDPGWFRAGNDGADPGDYNPKKYAVVAAMLRGLSEGVHDADPGARRIINFAGWLHVGFVQKIENDHIPYEILGIHWYQEMGDITCPGQEYPCPPNPKHFNVIQRVQSITRGKPMWMTETNYRAQAGKSDDENRSRIDAYLAPTLERYLHSPSKYPFQVVVIYELLDEVNVSSVTERQFGLLTVQKQPDGRYTAGAPKQSYQAVQRLLKR